MASKFLDALNYHLIPPVFTVFFTIIVQFLARIGTPTKTELSLENILGNGFAWTFIFIVVLWGFVWLWVPGKTFHGPQTTFGYTPVYKANGELFYSASVLLLGIILYVDPRLAVLIYENHAPILAGLNILAFGLCLYLLIKAKVKNHEDDPYLRSNKYPIAHEFYRGMELHPRLFGVDVKQLTNCRIGLILWQGLVIVDFVAATELHGFDPGHAVSTLLQTVYLYKFYHWETGYFNTLDITLDRAGYYICWGCLVWVPTLYTYHAYYFVGHPPNCSPVLATTLAIIGLLAIYWNYAVDRQKELFRTQDTSKFKIWGKKPEVVRASYRMTNGVTKETNLLVSGWWGIGRKINYTFELVAAYCWCACAGMTYGLWPYLYAIFLTILLLHRIYRDEDKCAKKYGKAWNTYCQRVPYRLIPYVF